MKQIMFLFAFLIGSLTTAPSAHANISAFAGLTISTIGEPTPTANTATIPKKAKGSWIKQAANWIIKKVSDMDEKTLIFVLVAAVIGPLGVHRILAGSKPIIVLWYILLGVLISAALIFLSFIGLGFFAYFGWLFYWILPILDIIKAYSKGLSHFEGNNNVFAGFK
jgi:hypothetical protein